MLFLRKCKAIKFITIITVIIIIAAVTGGFFWWASQPVDSGSQNKKIFIVKKGESLSSIASRLKKEGLIRSSLAFKIIVLAERLGGKIQAGSFHLSPSLTPYEIVTNLIHGTDDVWLTFPEGWRKEEYARRLEANLENFDSQEFLALTGNLEGYLFPDTYLLPKLASPSAVIKILTDNFEKKVGSVSKEVLILASIVEREAKYDQDRPIVAGILIKRWQRNWPLQADATVQYALANKQFDNLTIGQLGNFNWWPKITKDDLEINSPFNTYKYKNLPPTPICNPGVAAIKAVLNPTQTDYWYYLSDKNGVVHYAKTLEEHNQNIAKYLK